MLKHIRTRYAPSPTGYLHLGGLRTALFCYLLACHYNGEFIVRFEDTDKKREVSNAIQQMLNSLRSLGIEIDETIDDIGDYGPYKQSEKIEIYYKNAIKLIENKKAYYCFCTKEELEKECKEQKELGYKASQYSRKCFKLSEKEIKYNLNIKKEFTIRFKVVDDKKMEFKDMVYGNIKIQTKYIEDFIIVKANKFPTYNFSVVVDDHDMLISHVIRGSDHLSNTPKQILIYEAFDWKIPKFCHLTLIKNISSKKMSKRNYDEKQYLEYYIKTGYIPVALCNYLALLGWCPNLTKEIFDIDELIEKFDGTKLNKGTSTFSLVKLNWINKKHIKKLTSEEFWNFSKPFLGKYKNKLKIKEIVLLFQEEINYFSEINNSLDIFFNEKVKYTLEQQEILNKNKEILKLFLNIIKKINFTIEEIFDIVKIIKEKTNKSGKILIPPIRIAISGKTKGPKLRDLIYYLGKEKIIKFITNAIKE